MSGVKRWNSDKLLSQLRRPVSNLIGDIGSTMEGFSKALLYPGHGYDTGTLQRSIHTAQPGYNWKSDNRPRSFTTPERGGRFVPGKWVDKLHCKIQVGSGEDYSLYVHSFLERRRWGMKHGYQFFTKAIKPTKQRIPLLVQRNNFK